jgi:hypothetical protein
MKKTIIICAISFFSTVFADFPYRNSLEFSTSLYRYSYSEEFGDETGHIGFPRSDEYGPTVGIETEYKFFEPQSKFTFGLNFNFSRSIKHTYDGSLQGEILYIGDEPFLLYYQPIIQSTENYFLGSDIKFGYVAAISRRIIFEPNIKAAFDYWRRPVSPIVEDYLWLRILSGVTLTTKSKDNLGVVSDLYLSVPVWQKMYLKYGDANVSVRYKFDIGAKVGWKFNFGFARYYADNLTFKIVYSYEYYGFKASPPISISTEDGVRNYYEPSSSTHNNGVKISLEKGFGK